MIRNLLLCLLLVLHSISPVYAAAVPIEVVSQASLQPEAPVEESDEIDRSNDSSRSQTSIAFLAQSSPISPASVATVTHLPKEPVLTRFQSTQPPASMRVNQFSSAHFRATYDVRNPSSFSGVAINWGATAVKKVDLSGQSRFVFEMKMSHNGCVAAGAKCVKIEFVDTTNRKATVFARSVGKQFEEVAISKAGLLKSNPKLNLKAIKQINFVIDNAIANPDTGFFEVRTSGLGFMPTLKGTSYDPAVLTEIPGSPILNASKRDADNDSQIKLKQTSPRDFSFTYKMTDSADFGFVWEDLRGAKSADEITIAASIPLSKRMKVEVKDINGKIADFVLVGSGVKQNYTLDFFLDGTPAGFKTDSLVQITYVVDRALSGAGGTIVIERRGLDYVPVLTGLPFNSDQITTLPGEPTLGAGGGKTDQDPNASEGLGKITNQPSAEEFDFRYNLSGSPTAFAFAYIPFVREEGETLPEELIMAVKGPVGARVKLEIKDVNGRVADFILKLDGTLKNFVVTLAGDNVAPGFDRTAVREIVLVTDRVLAGETGLVNLLNVRIKGLDFTPVIGPS